MWERNGGGFSIYSDVISGSRSCVRRGRHDEEQIVFGIIYFS